MSDEEKVDDTGTPAPKLTRDEKLGNNKAGEAWQDENSVETQCRAMTTSPFARVRVEALHL
jgi:hypothetical protein